MLTFLHLSDLHITTTDAGTQFDRDAKIREALLEDLGKEGRTAFDAILVTGDIAYHGRAEEFARTKAWLEHVRTITGSSPEALFVVPGNHDVKLLQEDTKRPWSIKQRILSRHGHLSNEAAAAVVEQVVSADLRRVYLGHLSRDCNRPELAQAVINQRLQRVGAMHVRVETTRQATPCPTCLL